MSLHKIRNQVEDENGIKNLHFKVVAISKDGTVKVFIPLDHNLMREWQKQELMSTLIVQNKDTVASCF